MLTIKNLTVRYGSIPTLQGVSLTINQGEIIGLLGPNGAGKSTLLFSIVGLTEHKTGEVIFEDRNLFGLKTEDIVRRGISLVPENRRIFWNLSVEENIRIGATVRKDKEKIEEDIEEMLDYFPILKKYRKSAARYLSGGEQQQLAIARGLLSKPKLLLLDEPSLGLAPILVGQIFNTIIDLRDRGVTILLAEQYVNKTLSVADRVYALGNGTIRYSGSASEALKSADFKSQYLSGVSSKT